MTEYEKIIESIEALTERVNRIITERQLDEIAHYLAEYGYVKVVRCRDCVKRSKEPDPPVCGPGKVDSWIDWCIKHNCEVEPDGFCAWGKRKEDGE